MCRLLCLVLELGRLAQELESCLGGLAGGSLCCSVVSGEMQEEGSCCVNTAVMELQVEVGELSKVVSIFTYKKKGVFAL